MWVEHRHPWTHLHTEHKSTSEFRYPPACTLLPLQTPSPPRSSPSECVASALPDPALASFNALYWHILLHAARKEGTVLVLTYLVVFLDFSIKRAGYQPLRMANTNISIYLADITTNAGAQLHTRTTQRNALLHHLVHPGSSTANSVDKFPN